VTSRALRYLICLRRMRGLKDKKGSGICKNVLERGSQGQNGYVNLRKCP
jgi:hypothetical protein